MDKTWMRGLWITLSLLALLLAGCGTPSSRAGTNTSAPTATTRPTVTPVSTATSAPTATLPPAADACANLGGYGLPVGTPVRVGDLGISQVSFAYAYPAKQVPNGTALKPLQLPSSPNGAPGPNNPLPDSPPTNPNMTEPGGYRFHVCNVGAQSHMLQGVTVRMDAFAAYAGQLNAWQPLDGYYSRRFGVGCECGGGTYFADEYLHATFSAQGTTGAAVPAAQIKTGSSQGPGSPVAAPLPVTLAPGQSLEVNVGITAPTAPGTYTFGFAVVVDGASPVFFSSSPATLLAPVAHKWSGKGCTAPAMLAQIPSATTPAAFYICPEG